MLRAALTSALARCPQAVQQPAHALAYIILTDRRFADLYLWGQRTTPVSLAAEIQQPLGLPGPVSALLNLPTDPARRASNQPQAGAGPTGPASGSVSRVSTTRT